MGLFAHILICTEKAYYLKQMEKIDDLEDEESKKYVVKVRVKERVLDVSVGEGSQTFKWLASVVQERIKSLIAMRLMLADAALVVGFRDVNGDDIHPLDEIRQYISEEGQGVEVIADVAESLHSDEYGNPVLTEWSKAAYLVSPNARKWSNELDNWRERLANANEGKEGRESRSSNLVFIGELSAEDIESAFELDWQHITWGWLGMDVKDNTHKDIKDIIKRNYRLICNIFSHYCGEGEGVFIYRNISEFLLLID